MTRHLMPEIEIPGGAFIFADARAVALGEVRADFQTEAEAIVANADGEDRELTDDELARMEEIDGEVARLDRQIAARALTRVAKPGRRTTPEPTDARSTARTPARQPGARATVSPVPKDANAARTFGFDSFGQFAQTVINASMRDGDDRQTALDRIVNATTTYGNEGTGGEGGFLVPPDFRSQIWDKVLGEASLYSRVQQFVTGGNSLTFPKDETTPWDTSGGVQAYWGGEGDAKTPSKPLFTMQQLRLNKLFCLVPVSDELLQDAPGLESWLRAKAPLKMNARLNTALVRGNGVGKPKGFLAANSLVTVSKETSQVADSIVYNNILNMWMRMYAPCRANAVWVINQDIEAQLMSLAFPAATGTVVPVYLPGGSIAGSPYGTLLGRPVLPVEAASTLGDKGDISLVDFSQYMGLTKGNDIQTDVSIHIYFDQDLTAFRFVLRVAGEPLWGSSVVPENGNMSRSWAVTLEDRA